MQARELMEDGVQILQLEGDIDLHSSRDLRTLLAEHAKARRPAVLLDLTGVRYMDSSGLATIVEYARQAQSFRGKLALAGLNERVRTVFELVRLHEFLSIYGSIAEARAALSEA